MPAASSPALLASSEQSSAITTRAGGQRSPSPHTTRTGQRACWTTPSETLPIRRRFTPPKPRQPTTTSPASVSSAAHRIWSTGEPMRSRASSTAPPIFSIRPTCSSRTLRPCFTHSEGECSLSAMPANSRGGTNSKAWTTSSSAPLLFARSTATRPALSAHSEPSVASNILFGKWFMSLSFLLGTQDGQPGPRHERQVERPADHQMPGLQLRGAPEHEVHESSRSQGQSHGERVERCEVPGRKEDAERHGDGALEHHRAGHVADRDRK